MEVRRLLEPAATGLAAARMSDAALDELGRILDSMRAAENNPKQLIHYDTAFHRAVIAATGNETLTSLLGGLSGRTVRAPPRSWSSGCGSWLKTVTSWPARIHSRASARV